MKNWETKNRPLNQWPLYEVEERLSAYKKQLQRELKAYGLSFDFHLWVSDEWFCPDGVPGFALPFYLFNPELKKYHKKQTGSVEGRTDTEILKLMRHELGHAIDNAFALRKNKERQQVFGSPERAYPESYQPKPYSKNYVRYLGEGYAQSHPDEDFAETFAYWLDPDKRWRMKSLNGKVTVKLNFMDRLMRQLRGKTPVLKNRFRIDPIEKNGMTLDAFYNLYHKERKTSALLRVDHELRQAFQWPRERGVSLAFFLRKEKNFLKKRLSQDEGIYEYEAEQVLKKVIQRADNLEIKGSVYEFRKRAPDLLKRNFHVLKQQDLLRVYL